MKKKKKHIIKKKTEPWTLKVAFRPSGVLLVYQAGNVLDCVSTKRMRIAVDSNDVSDPWRHHGRTDAKRDNPWRFGGPQGPPGKKVHRVASDSDDLLSVGGASTTRLVRTRDARGRSGSLRPPGNEVHL